MRTLHVIASVNPELGGPIEGLRQLSRVLNEAGHELEIASLDNPDEPFLPQLAPITVHALGSRPGVYHYSPNLVGWLQQHAAEYDAVFVRGNWQYSGLGTWRALRGTGVPYFVFPHGMLDPWFKKQYPLKHVKKLLYWPWAEYRVLRDAAAVLFTTEEERVLARQSFKPYRCNEVVVNYGTRRPPGDPGVLRTAFHAAFPALEGQRFVLFLSRIHAKKGCDLLIEAFARTAARDPNLKLVMAGPDQTGLRAELEAATDRLGIRDRVVWTGMLAGDVKYGAFYAADAFALPSHQENFGIAVAEALACGVPVIISNKVNIWREIEHAGAGCVGDDTVDGTTRALEQWLSKSVEERHAMSDSARRLFNTRFDIVRSGEHLMEIVATYRRRDSTGRSLVEHAANGSNR